MESKEDTTAPAASVGNDSSKPTKTNSKPIIAISITFLIFVLSIIIYFCIFYKKGRAVPYDKPIPYIFNQDFLSALNEYVSLPTHNEILVIYGPKGVGKTRGLFEFGNMVYDDGRLVIDFDFQKMSKAANMDDIVVYIRKTIGKYLMKYSEMHLRSDNELKNKLNIIETLTSMYKENNNYNSIDLKMFTFRDQVYQELLNQLFFITEIILEDSKYGLDLLLKSLNLLDNWKPVIIIHDLDNIQENDFILELIKSLSMFIENQKNIGIIIEVSDQKALFDGTFPINNHKFRYYYVNEFSNKEIKNLLVKDNIFSKKDMEYIIDHFGHNGQLYATVHDMMREGNDVMSAYQKFKRHYSNIILRFIEYNSTSKIRAKRVAFLNKLFDEQRIPINTDLDISHSLIEWKIITMSNLTHCMYQNKVMQDSANEILQIFNK